MKYIFWNTRLLEIFSFIWLLLGLIFFTSLALDENDNTSIENCSDERLKEISLYRNDTLYLVNNDLGKLVGSIWELDSNTTSHQPTIMLVDSLPNQ